MAKDKPESTAMVLSGLAIPACKDALSVIDEDAILGSRNELITSVDTDSPEGRRAVYNAKRGTVANGKDYLNKTINVSHFVMHRAQGTNEVTGEQQTWIRTVLILEDGTMIAFGSDGIVASLADLCRYYRSTPWNPALKLTLKSESMAGGKNWYKLELAE